MMKMFTDPRTPANVKSVSDSITMTWLLPHASEDLAQCDDHCSHSFSIKQGKVKACVEFSFYILCRIPWTFKEDLSGGLISC